MYFFVSTASFFWALFRHAFMCSLAVSKNTTLQALFLLPNPFSESASKIKNKLKYQKIKIKKFYKTLNNIYLQLKKYPFTPKKSKILTFRMVYLDSIKIIHLEDKMVFFQFLHLEINLFFYIFHKKKHFFSRKTHGIHQKTHFSAEKKSCTTRKNIFYL